MPGPSTPKAINSWTPGPRWGPRLSGRLVCPVDGSVYHLVTNPPKVDKLCDIDGTPLVQREDDSEETVLRRLEVYGQRTKPLYDLYREKGILDEVDAIGSAEDVYDRLLKARAEEPEGPQGGSGGK